jgi:hypothetical protein
MSVNVQIMPGDFVEWAGSGWCSALIGGPGKVVSIDEITANVMVLHPGECLGNKFKKGEILIFGLKSLKRIEGGNNS